MTNIDVIQEILGDDEDFRTGIGYMIRIGRPVLQECQDKADDTLGGAAIVIDVVADDRNKPRHKISNLKVCATSKGSDQPAHTHS